MLTPSGGASQLSLKKIQNKIRKEFIQQKSTPSKKNRSSPSILSPPTSDPKPKLKKRAKPALRPAKDHTPTPFPEKALRVQKKQRGSRTRADQSLMKKMANIIGANKNMQKKVSRSYETIYETVGETLGPTDSDSSVRYRFVFVIMLAIFAVGLYLYIDANPRKCEKRECTLKTGNPMRVVATYLNSQKCPPREKAMRVKEIIARTLDDIDYET